MNLTPQRFITLLQSCRVKGIGYPGLHRGSRDSALGYNITPLLGLRKTHAKQIRAWGMRLAATHAVPQVSSPKPQASRVIRAKRHGAEDRSLFDALSSIYFISLTGHWMPAPQVPCTTAA